MWTTFSSQRLNTCQAAETETVRSNNGGDIFVL
jgi:hypothetical protein